MSGVGFSELIILALIGLIVLGPERLPRVASQLGNWIGQARRMTRVMRRQLEDELDFDENLKPKKKPGTHRTPAEASAPSPEAHAPHDDDTYSPLHIEESNALSATADELARTDPEESSSPESEPDAEDVHGGDETAEKAS